MTYVVPEPHAPRTPLFQTHMQLMPERHDSGTGTTNFQIYRAANAGTTKFPALAVTDLTVGISFNTYPSTGTDFRLMSPQGRISVQ